MSHTAGSGKLHRHLHGPRQPQPLGVVSESRPLQMKAKRMNWWENQRDINYERETMATCNLSKVPEEPIPVLPPFTRFLAVV